MALKYKLKLKDLKLEYIKEYISPIFNFLKPKKKFKVFQIYNPLFKENLHGYLRKLYMDI